jgi:hypothetical protein
MLSNANEEWVDNRPFLKKKPFRADTRKGFFNPTNDVEAQLVFGKNRSAAASRRRLYYLPSTAMTS